MTQPAGTERKAAGYVAEKLSEVGYEVTSGPGDGTMFANTRSHLDTKPKEP